MGLKHVNLANKRMGSISKNRYGSKMKIVEYNNANYILVKFEQGEPIKTRWKEFVIGEVKNPYDRTIYEIGFIGEGKYKPNIEGKKTNQYKIWVSMFQRCYDEKFSEIHPTYKESIVCEDWHNFQNFAKWYDENYYGVDSERMNLDKDILLKGNKIYSPETCVIVPQKINILFVKSDSIRGKFPIGIHYEKQTNKYKAQCKIGKGKVKNLGRYDTPEAAFDVYKTFKEKYIKEIANRYRENIPKKLYDAMYSYRVEITD